MSEVAKLTILPLPTVAVEEADAKSTTRLRSSPSLGDLQESDQRWPARVLFGLRYVKPHSTLEAFVALEFPDLGFEGLGV